MMDNFAEESKEVELDAVEFRDILAR